MAKQQLDASLDAFDALISRYDESTGPVTGPVQPRTRREARALREAQEAAEASSSTTAASSSETVPAETVAQTEKPADAPQPMTRREARALRDAAPKPAPTARQQAAEPQPASTARAATPADRAAARARRRGHAAAASAAALALVPALMFAAPANASSTIASNLQNHGTAQHTTAQQILDVAASAQQPTVDQVNYVAAQLASLVADNGGEDAKLQAPAIAAALQIGGPRQQIIEAALSYLGTPYVFDGDSYSGIDCSGLTMRAYQAVGIQLVHLVSAQDSVGTRITAAEAQPGDLVVFNDEDHVGIYLGGGQVLHAPEYGRPVQISSLDTWVGVGIHYTRILPAGE